MHESVRAYCFRVEVLEFPLITTLFFFPFPVMLWERIFLSHWFQCLGSNSLLTLAPDSESPLKLPLSSRHKDLLMVRSSESSSPTSTLKVIEIFLLHGTIFFLASLTIIILHWSSSYLSDTLSQASFPSLFILLMLVSHSTSFRLVFPSRTLILGELIHSVGFMDQLVFWYFWRLFLRYPPLQTHVSNCLLDFSKCPDGTLNLMFPHRTLVNMLYILANGTLFSRPEIRKWLLTLLSPFSSHIQWHRPGWSSALVSVLPRPSWSSSLCPLPLFLFPHHCHTWPS